ncbi:hypothetical protein BDD12DRAFT_883058 [Trichophaea hybrida]|nr:hypothetical protein BDD12DRAFT_883058 [Trichophaea hybrida]
MPANEFITILDGSTSSTSLFTTPAASSDDSGHTDILYKISNKEADRAGDEEPTPSEDDVPVAKNFRESTHGKGASS